MGSLNRYMKIGSFMRDQYIDDNNENMNLGISNSNTNNNASASNNNSNKKGNKMIYSNKGGPNTLIPPRFILAKRYDFILCIYKYYYSY